MAAEKGSDQERIILLRTALAVLVLARRSAGGDADLAMVRVAMRISQLEGRPLDLSALAVITGIPYTTIRRKLQALELEWQREGRRLIPQLPPGPSLDGVRNLMTLRTIILNACREMGLL